jgi:hypothetical protein
MKGLGILARERNLTAIIPTPAYVLAAPGQSKPPQASDAAHTIHIARRH